MNCIMGMAFEKQAALEHPYPATKDKIEKFGYDPKQLSHALRLREFMSRFMDEEPYADCLRSKQRDYLIHVKLGLHTLEEARELMDNTVASMKEDKQRYMDFTPLLINKEADDILKCTTIEILKRAFLRELQNEGGAS